MPTNFNIGDAIAKAFNVLWGTKADDNTQGESVDVTRGHAHVAAPGQLYGQPAPFNVAWSSTAHRVRVPAPTGAKSFSLNNNTNQMVRVVFNLAGTTEANNALAETADGASAGLELTGKQCYRVKAGESRTFPFAPDDLMYYADIKPEVNATGNCDGVTLL